MPSSSVLPSRKRKRDEAPTAEIEVDVAAPEPPSKKALRKAKKTKLVSSSSDTAALKQSTSKVAVAAVKPDSAADEDPAPAFTVSSRSVHGIWIGNLPWTAKKADIRNFLTNGTGIKEDMITRLHMPPPSKSASASALRQKTKPQNQGFAYVDFLTAGALVEALALSEKLLTGRRLLIKDSKSFEGRPEKSREESAAQTGSSKPPNNRIFVGNLGFDTTKDMLQDHFEKCGEIQDIHLATFEDSGKCKGYAWVHFAEVEAGKAAVRGWVDYEQKENAEDEDDEIAEALADEEKPKKKVRQRKWWVNRLGGRLLRMEFAEGKDVRYKKRYGKEGTARQDKDEDSVLVSMAQPESDERAKRPFGKRDARTVKPGAALATAPRLTGGIVPSQGTKTILA
ncbi:hypothetical protein MMC21_001692 [Puttea exsequens]|nr:hypothetical protein [Puttea exsequens]